jgi:hypothetical protein
MECLNGRVQACLFYFLKSAEPCSAEHLRRGTSVLDGGNDGSQQPVSHHNGARTGA